MDFFCLIALRDWFVNLNDRILREAEGEQAIDHYWPCNTRFSGHKKICDEPGEMFAGRVWHL